MSNKLPLNIKNAMRKYSPFQQKVWLACLAIPRGKTLSYSQLASRIGRPRTARAVGNALKKNPFAPIIPCHRVIKSDGTLGGYSARGGAGRKRQLLKKEFAL